MAQAEIDELHETEPIPPEAGDFVARLFTLVMTGVIAVILLMILAANG